MANVEYDLENKGVVYAQLRALIDLPSSEDSKAKKKEGLELHPYYRRPGKGHNRDICDGCQEGGNLLCCDRCPASFHFICVDPPIEEEKDIPLGGWICNKCTYKMESKIESNDVTIKGMGKGKKKNVSGSTRKELRVREGEKIKEEKVMEKTCLEEDAGPGPSDEDETEYLNIARKSKRKGTRRDAPTPAKRELRSREMEKDSNGEINYVEKEEENWLEEAAGLTDNDDDSVENMSPKGKGLEKDKCTTGSSRRYSSSHDNNEQEMLENLFQEAGGVPKTMEDAKDTSLEKNCGSKKYFYTKEQREEEIKLPEKPHLLEAFQTMARNAKRDNPSEFSLPKELKLNYPFPGDDRGERRKVFSRRSSSGSKRKRYEPEVKAKVPDFSKSCFYCKKTTNHKNMIACDFCPLQFHLDCLNPPEIRVPDKSLWRCPVHNENFLDEYLVRPCSVTDRIKVYEKYAHQPIDHHTVKLDFLKKVQRDKLRYRPFYVNSVPRLSLQVSDYVKGAYNHPVDLLPGIREVLRYKDAVGATTVNLCCSTACHSHPRPSEVNLTVKNEIEKKSKGKLVDIEMIPNEYKASQSDQELFLSSLLEFHKEHARLFFPEKYTREFEENLGLLSESKKIEMNTEIVDKAFKKSEALNGLPEIPTEKKDVFDHLCNGDSQSVNGHLTSESVGFRENNHIAIEDEKKKTITLNKFYSDEFASNADLKPTFVNSLTSLNQLSDEAIKKLAPERLQKITDEEKTENSITIHDIDFTPELPTEKFEVTYYEKRVIEELRKKIKGTFFENRRATEINIRWSSPSEEPKMKRIVNKDMPNGIYALLFPFNSENDIMPPVSLNKVTTLGNDRTCDIILTEYKHCNFIDKLHAYIYYNREFNRFEIQNMSPTGTVVNNVRLGAGWRPVTTDNLEASSSKLKKSIDDIVSGRRAAYLKKRAESEIKNKKPLVNVVPCRCENKQNIPSYEGPMYINHGAYIMFGCIEFIFVVSEINKTDNRPVKI